MLLIMLMVIGDEYLLVGAGCFFASLFWVGLGFIIVRSGKRKGVSDGK